MKTIRTKVYQFNELSKAAQQTAIEDERNDYQKNGEPLYFFDEYCKDKAAEEGFKDCKFAWSLGYCQGDGLSFSCDRFDLEQFFTNNTRLRQLFIKPLAAHCIVVLKGNDGRYAFASRSDVDLYLDANKDYPRIEEIIALLRTELEDKYLALCEELQKDGYKWIESEDEDNSIIDRIEANEYEFTKDGKRFNY